LRSVTRPTMRFVPVKSPEQQAALSMHRTRDLLVKQRTLLINMIRERLHPTNATASIYLLQRGSHPQRTQVGHRAISEKCPIVLQKSKIERPRKWRNLARRGKWRQSQPSSELPPRAELMRIANRCRKSHRTDRPDAGDVHETPCNIVST
jgi:hypothetical protein